MDIIGIALQWLLNLLDALGSESLFGIMWRIFVSGGWIAFVVVGWRGGKKMWLLWRQNKFAAGMRFVLLAIDVPRTNEQSPKAVEYIFTHLHGAMSSANFVEKWWKGKFQESFSLELISIDGFIQFLVRAPANYRDLVEAAVYAQYPDAEIVEVADYAEEFRMRFPNDEYDLWGTELILGRPEAFPIRTYPEFEHKLTGEFKDPMASVLEAMSRFHAGEQVWIQLVITPVDERWEKGAEKIVRRITGQKAKVKQTLVGQAIGSSLGLATNIISGAAGSVLGISPGEGKKKDSKPAGDQFKMMSLTPGERAALEAIQLKTTKLAFRTKFRVLYLGKKEVFNKGRSIAVILGSMKQFAAVNLNGFRPSKQVTTKANYVMVRQRVAYRQNKILRAYRGRSNHRGAKGFVLSTEELASIWHFPNIEVKAPLVKKTEAKRAEPPFGLPSGASPRPEPRMAPQPVSPTRADEPPVVSDVEPPPNLPVV